MYSEVETRRADKLIAKHAPLVKKIAHHLLARLPASVQVDDLIQAGMIGLLEAAKKYESTKGATFETYAGIRIRGSMMDEVRKGDWVPRSVRQKASHLDAVANKLQSKLHLNLVYETQCAAPIVEQPIHVANSANQPGACLHWSGRPITQQVRRLRKRFVDQARGRVSINMLREPLKYVKGNRQIVCFCVDAFAR